MTPKTEIQTAKALAADIKKYALTVPHTLRFMEVCGTHTMAIHAAGIKSLLPANLRLVSGPGCPVCVTEKNYIDNAILVGRQHNACLVTFGDLIRVPGSLGSLGGFRAEGGNVKVVYSPSDAINVALSIAPQPTVFLGVGFETTIPTVAATLKMAKMHEVKNLYVLPAFKTIHPPLKILAAKTDLHGFLLPGHVSAILGSKCYEYLVDDFKKPGVVAGFEALDILLAIRDLVRMNAEEIPRIINDYKRVVRENGNPSARSLMDEVFVAAEASWRGLGVIPGSGLQFSEPYVEFDARSRFGVVVPESADDPRCKCAAIITGSQTPDRCALFGRECTPEDPIGPCMVSSEGTCAAYYKYGAA